MREQGDVVDAARPALSGRTDRAGGGGGGGDRALPRRLLVTVIFIAAILVMIRPDLSSLTTHIPANTGDPAFYIWVLLWGNHALVTDPTHFFDANIFWPHLTTLAYADTVIPLIPVFGILHAATGSWALSLDILALSLVLLNLLATYSLARRISGRTDAAVLGALAFGFSAYVFSHWSHLQLETLGLIPLAFLLLFKLLDKPSAGLAVLVGVVSAAVALAAVYDGASYGVAAAVVVLGYLVVRRPRDPWLVFCLGIAAVVAALLMLPVVTAYLHLQGQPGFRRTLDPASGLRLGNLAAPAIDNFVWGPVGPSATAVGFENRFFPGVVAVALASIGGIALVWQGRRATTLTAAARRSRLELSLLVLVGAAALILAFGPSVGGLPGPFRFFHDHVPGFAGIRIEARFTVIAMLAVAILASYGYAWLATRLRGQWVAIAVAVGLGGIMLVELATPLSWAKLPDDEATLAVYRDLAHRPPGPVVELPETLGQPYWPFIDAPRMVYSSLDWHPRLGGYSAYVPPTLPADSQVMNTFPSRPSLDLARRLRIRYVILHVGLENGLPMLTPAQAQRIISSLPPGATATPAASSWLVDLGPS